MVRFLLVMIYGVVEGSVTVSCAVTLEVLNPFMR